MTDHGALDTAVKRFPWLLRRIAAGTDEANLVEAYAFRIRAEYRVVLKERAKAAAYGQ